MTENNTTEALMANKGMEDKMDNEAMNGSVLNPMYRDITLDYIDPTGHFKAYIFMGNPETSEEWNAYNVMVDVLSDEDDQLLFIQEEVGEMNQEVTMTDLDQLQVALDQKEITYYGNSAEGLRNIVFCIVETDIEKRLAYLKMIKEYTNENFDSAKIIFLTTLESLFMDRLVEHQIELSNAVYAPIISDLDFETIGVAGDFELTSVPKDNSERLKEIYGNIIEYFSMDFDRNHVGFTNAIHYILLKCSYDYMTWCFQQHIIKYGTIVNMSEKDIDSAMEYFGFEQLLNGDESVKLPDAQSIAKSLSYSILPKHSIVSAAMISETNRLNDIIQSAAKIIIANKFSKIGIFGIPKEKSIYAKIVNELTRILNGHVAETELTSEPYTYNFYLIDHCNDNINTQEDQIQNDYGFDFAIICDNKFLVDNGTNPNINILTYLDVAKTKYLTLDVNTSIVYGPAVTPPVEEAIATTETTETTESEAK